MADKLAKKNSFITRFRQEMTGLLGSSAQLKALVGEYNALDYANNLADADFIGENAHMTSAELAAAVTLISQLFSSNTSVQSDAILYAILR